jgi:predicted metal-dependent hydrolase
VTSNSITFGATIIAYQLIYSRRKTLGIQVYPDGRVVVRAPRGAPLREIESVVRKKASWIIKKQAAFAQHTPPPPPRQYVNGEMHLYLGQSYPLQIIKNQKEMVELHDGCLLLKVRDEEDLARKQKLLEQWYRAQAKIIFVQRLEAIYPQAAQLGIPFPQLKIRKMKSRWGSCSNKGSINLNLRLIQTSISCIDYVIMHELAHLKEHNHSRAYYNLLDNLMPDWRKRREELHQHPVV